MVMIYKIFRSAEWSEFTKAGSFGGSVHDQRDGFIHMCARSQLSGTLAKHFSGDDELVLAAFNESHVKNLKWEISRGGEKFPHIYGPLPRSALDGDWPLVKNGDGVFVLPFKPTAEIL